MNRLFHWLLMLPPQASSAARGVDLLHYTVIGSAMVVATLSLGWAGYSLVRPPRRRRAVPRWFEIGLIAFTTAAFLAWWVVGFAQYRALREAPADAIRVHVVAKQWMWEFVYPNGATAQDTLRVPVGRPVEVLITSRDVIHSFYVPAFRQKEDAVPGRVTSLWFTATAPGSYDILCAEYCGSGHSEMRGRVLALPPDAYARWVDGHAAEDLAQDGEHLAVQHGCLRCHTTDGSPHLGPTWRGLYGARVTLADGRTVTADPAYLTASMMDPAADVVAGFPPVMPTYLGQLEAPEAAAIVEYIRSLGARP